MRSKSTIKHCVLISSLLLASASIICFNVVAKAQGINSVTNYLPPGQSPNQGAPPAPGDGPQSAAVIPGDANQVSSPVTSGQAVSSPQNGNVFSQTQERRRSRINLFMKEPYGRGTRTVLTFQPDQLTNEQRGQVMGIIPGAINSNAPYQSVSVTQQQLVSMQKILAPYPKTGTSAVPMRAGKNGPQRNQIFSDGNPSARLRQNGTNGINPVLPELRNFCRYLVILGVVCGCIFMSFAAVGLQFGDRNAGARIIGSMGGIMLLLMSFAIWKVVRLNENNARGPVNRVVDLKKRPPVLSSRSYNGDVYRIKADNSFVSPTDANLPVSMPGSINTPPGRSGLPLNPLGANH